MVLFVFSFFFLPSFQLHLLQRPSTSISIEGIDEANVFRYILELWTKGTLKPEKIGPWINGSIWLYECERTKWYTKSQSVKFFILGEEFNDDAKKVEVYKKSIDLIKHGSHRGVITPIFVTYCSRFSRMIV